MNIYPTNQMNRKILITILTILGLAIIAGCFWYYLQSRNNTDLTRNDGEERQEQNQQMNNEKENENQKQEERKNENENGEESDFKKIDTSNWKEYCNKEYGFCFKYPRNWFCGGIALDPKSTTNIFCMSKEFKEKYYAGEYHGAGIMIYIDNKKQIYNNVDKYGVISDTLEGEKYNIQFTVFPKRNDQNNWIQDIFFNLKYSFRFTK